MAAPLPRHSSAFRFRRFVNWFPLGLAYAFLYMGRYNLTVAKNALGQMMSNADFGDIFGIGAVVYGCAFIINGPFTDKLGGRFAMLVGVAGSIGANIAMGVVLLGVSRWGWALSIKPTFIALYSMNMYFQSFGAVAIVTTKAPWFHVRERGSFSTIFSIMISMGIYFAFDWGRAVVEATRGTHPELGVVATGFQALLGSGGAGVDENWFVFFTPAGFLTILWVVLFFLLRNSPGEAGYEDFETGEESVSADGERLPVSVVFIKIITHPVLAVICVIEFCSGILRNGIMHWYLIFAKQTGFRGEFVVTQNWGVSLLICGVVGGVLTGWCSDRFFQSRRAPMAGVLYLLIFVAATSMIFTLDAPYWYAASAALSISMAVIGVHGIMSGTSTADFGGSKNTGAAVGAVDGLVYLGTGIQSFVIGRLAPTGEAAKDPNNWTAWPMFLAPFALLGFVMALKIWNAKPGQKKAATELEPSAAD